MKKLSLILIILSGLATGACKAQQVPADSIPGWLNEKIAGFKTGQNARVEAYFYRQDTVYLLAPCTGCPDQLTMVYDKAGEIMCRFGGIAGVNSCPDFAEKAKLIRQIWPKK